MDVNVLPGHVLHMWLETVIIRLISYFKFKHHRQLSDYIRLFLHMFHFVLLAHTHLNHHPDHPAFRHHMSPAVLGPLSCWLTDADRDSSAVHLSIAVIRSELL